MKTIETKSEIQLEHDATPSWNGFNYQGKVALYVTLYLLNHPYLISKTDEEKWDMYYLEIEFLEDFSIKKGDKYHSIHQVKAYKDGENLSKYSNAIWGLIRKSEIKSISDKAYLHTLLPITELKERTNQSASIIKNLNPSNDRLKLYREQSIYSEDFETIFKKVAFYDDMSQSYELYCELNQIEGLIKKQIKKFYENSQYEGYLTADDYLTKVYINMLAFIDKHVSDRHQHILETSIDERAIPSISFEKIIELLNKDYSKPEKGYWIFLLKNQITKMLDDYCFYCAESNGECDRNSCRLNNYIKKVHVLKELDYLDFLSNVNPRCIIEELGGDSYTNLVQRTGYYKMFDFLMRVKQIVELNRNRIIFIKNKNKEQFVPTTLFYEQDDEKNRDTEKRMIAKAILRNTVVINNLYEVDTMVSHNINIEYLGKIVNDIGQIEMSVDEGENKIIEMKKIRILDKNQAEGELNNE